jgi:GNAT superfamily N-acetyltransferase
VIIKELPNSELERLTEINREEQVREAYVLKNGELEVQQVNWDVPDWPMDGSDDFSMRGNFERWKPIMEAGGVLLTALEEETLIGFAILRPQLTKSMAQLAELHVSNGYRGKGVGTMLIQETFRLAKEGGATDMYVSSIPTKNSVDFYMKHGFRPAEEVHPELYELEPEDIHMVKPL